MSWHDTVDYSPRRFPQFWVAQLTTHCKEFSMGLTTPSLIALVAVAAAAPAQAALWSSIDAITPLDDTTSLSISRTGNQRTVAAQVDVAIPAGIQAISITKRGALQPHLRPQDPACSRSQQRPASATCNRSTLLRSDDPRDLLRDAMVHDEQRCLRRQLFHFLPMRARSRANHDHRTLAPMAPTYRAKPAVL